MLIEALDEGRVSASPLAMQERGFFASPHGGTASNPASDNGINGGTCSTRHARFSRMSLRSTSGVRTPQALSQGREGEAGPGSRRAAGASAREARKLQENGCCRDRPLWEVSAEHMDDVAGPGVRPPEDAGTTAASESDEAPGEFRGTNPMRLAHRVECRFTEGGMRERWRLPTAKSPKVTAHGRRPVAGKRFGAIVEASGAASRGPRPRRRPALHSFLPSARMGTCTFTGCPRPLGACK
jgi:hypothetical protein